MLPVPTQSSTDGCSNGSTFDGTDLLTRQITNNSADSRTNKRTNGLANSNPHSFAYGWPD